LFVVVLSKIIKNNKKNIEKIVIIKNLTVRSQKAFPAFRRRQGSGV
jgi:hypothetical protein